MGTPVEIFDYDPEWPRIFARLRDKIASSLGSLATRIEHVGSTAVPGLAAKPVIDLDVVISCWADLPAVISNLRPLGYHPQGDLGVPGREAFASPSGEPSHHLYVCMDDSPQLAQHLTFRDALRAQPETARAYADLKRSLAEKFGGDRTAYADAKTAFVKRVLATAAHSEHGRSEVGRSSQAVAFLERPTEVRRFTAGIRSFPPGLVRPGCDDNSAQADQSAPVRHAVGEHGQAAASSAFVSLPDEERQTFGRVGADRVEAVAGMAVAKVGTPAA